jgi:exodeoxyribonuclease VII small subunit
VKEEWAMTEIQDMAFEEAFSELEEVVNRLEVGGLPLEDSLALFERGQALAAHCSELLDEAELKVKQITPEGEEPFSPER